MIIYLKQRANFSQRDTEPALTNYCIHDTSKLQSGFLNRHETDSLVNIFHNYKTRHNSSTAIFGGTWFVSAAYK